MKILTGVFRNSKYKFIKIIDFGVSSASDKIESHRPQKNVA